MCCLPLVFASGDLPPYKRPLSRQLVMPLLTEIITSSPKNKAPKPLVRAHFVEEHWIHPKLPWEQAARELVQLFPRDTRPERPRAWYRRLAGTHWPGQIPPGNGPFYVPEWTIEDNEAGDAIRETLKKAGFRKAEAHALYLPQNSEQLVVAMRAADQHPWTANPLTGRAYIYPRLRRTPDRELRPYNVDRWRL